MTSQTLPTSPTAARRRPRLVLYPETPLRRVRQLIADLLLLAWISAWAWLAVHLHQWVTRLGTLGETVHNAGQDLADNITTLQNTLSGLPLVGDHTDEPLAKAGATAQTIASAGTAEQRIIDDLSIVLVVLLLVGPVALVILRWIPRRIRKITRATATARLRDQPAGIDLLALRALANQPLARLAKLGPDPAAAWRQKQPAIIRKLADLELRRHGLRATTPATGNP
ncbi:hypothetical protein ACQPZP_00440 [Spirillospora sp. CA-142024]|uniref:hypothetical protein n=1 Tax=Spirillospora sp. CA-142024 TaxID=3240036 RepID=UPI003D944128